MRAHLVVLVGMTLAAFTLEPSASHAADGVGSLEEVVVTARKQQESLQDVPIAITAFSSDAIEKFGITNPFDLAALTPGLYYQNVGYRNSDKPSIRGVTTASTLPAQQKVSVFVDGIYVSGVFGTQSLADLERVEVLKGPQSSFFGRSTFAGAINYITKDPTDELSGSLSATAATLGETQVSARIGGPILDERLLGQLSVYSYEFRGPEEWRNAGGGQRVGDESTQAVSGKLILDAGAGGRYEARAYYGEDDDGQLTALFVPASRRDGMFVRPNGTVGRFPLGEIDAVPADFRYNLSSFDNPGIDRTTTRTSLDADWSLGRYTLQGSAAYNDQKAYLQADFDLGPGDFFRLNQVEEYTDTSAELRLSSPQDAAFRFLVGLYYLDLETDVQGRNAFLNVATPSRTLTNVKNEAVFGGAYFDIGSQFTVGLEGRYQSDEVEVQNIQRVSFGDTFYAFLPRVTLDWKLNPDLLVYLLGSRGNNPGDFNTDLRLPAELRSVDEETLTNVETGLKSTWLDGRLRLNVAAYYMEWKDQQQRRTVQVSSVPLVVLTANLNEGNSTIKGIEVEADLAPTPEWDLRASFNFQDAKFDEFCSTNFFTLTGIESIPGGQCRSVAGNYLEAQPRVSGSIAATYTRSVGDGFDWYVGSDVAYQSKTYSSEMNLAWSPDAAIANLRLGILRNDLRLELFARNLFDEDSPPRVARLSDFSLGLSSALNQSVAVTQRRPRQVGVRVTYDF